MNHIFTDKLNLGILGIVLCFKLFIVLEACFETLPSGVLSAQLNSQLYLTSC